MIATRTHFHEVAQRERAMGQTPGRVGQSRGSQQTLARHIWTDKSCHWRPVQHLEIIQNRRRLPKSRAGRICQILFRPPVSGERDKPNKIPTQDDDDKEEGRACIQLELGNCDITSAAADTLASLNNRIGRPSLFSRRKSQAFHLSFSRLFISDKQLTKA